MTACMMLYTPPALPIVDLLWSSRQLGHGARAQGQSLRRLASSRLVAKADVVQQVKLKVDVQKDSRQKGCATNNIGEPSTEFPVSQTGTQRTGATATLA